LRGLRPRTRDGYLGCVRLLGQHYGQDPANLEEAQVRAYFLMLHRDRHYAAETLGVAAVACRKFYRECLNTGRGWAFWQELRVRRTLKLPEVLTVEETAQLLGAVRQDRFRTILRLIYATGLRLREACALRPEDLRARPGAVRVREGKGGRERYVPIAAPMVEDLRRFWRRHGHSQWLFPSLGPVVEGKANGFAERAGRATAPLRGAAVEEACRLALAQSGLRRRATPHTLRHCYATHLLEAGVPLRLISHYLGHAHLETTLRYVHLTAASEARVVAALESLWQQTIDRRTAPQR
jgi:integrase/recombinase XerD